MQAKLFALFYLAVCFHSSQARCFSTYCHHGLTFAECLTGSYVCQDDEYCEVITSIVPDQFPAWTMACNPRQEMYDCLSHEVNNDPACQPNTRSLSCYWCCPDAACLHALANQSLPIGGATTTPESTLAP